MSKQFNFKELPKEVSGDGFAKPGIHEVKIKSITEQISSTGSRMLVVINNIKGHEKLDITDRYTYEDAIGNKISFGEFKLRRLMEATNTIPEGNFTIPVLIRMLTGKSYIAEIIEEEYNGKTYLNIGSPDNFKMTEEVLDTLEPTPTPATEPTPIPTPAPAEIEQDDEI